MIDTKVRIPASDAPAASRGTRHCWPGVSGAEVVITMALLTLGALVGFRLLTLEGAGPGPADAVLAPVVFVFILATGRRGRRRP